MKKILFILSVLLISCESKYSYKELHKNAIVSYMEVREPGAKTRGWCYVYIHTKKETIYIDVGYENREKFNVGDTIPLMLVLIENK